jgi:hypothetical protein
MKRVGTGAWIALRTFGGRRNPVEPGCLQPTTLEAGAVPTIPKQAHARGDSIMVAQVLE